MNAIEFVVGLRELGFSQREFAEYSGVREETISRWARDRKPIPKHIGRLVAALKRVKELQSEQQLS